MIGGNGTGEASTYTIPSRPGTSTSYSPCVNNELNHMGHNDDVDVS